MVAFINDAIKLNGQQQMELGKLLKMADSAVITALVPKGPFAILDTRPTILVEAI